MLVAFIPLLIFAVGVSGILLTSRFQDPATVLVDLLVENIPRLGRDIDTVAVVREQFDRIMAQRTGFTVIGVLFLIWFSTRLVGTLRTALREVFDVAQERGIVEGKIFDAKMVVVVGVLFLVNIGITTAVVAAQNYGIGMLGLGTRAVSTIEATVAWSLSFASIWVLFALVYRFLPVRAIPWRTALIAATFTAVLHEVLKLAFGWYATNFANWQTTYGNLVTVAALFLWIYYEAIVFVLGGEVAQVWTMRRARRINTRRALFGGEGAPPAARATSETPTRAR